MNNGKIICFGDIHLSDARPWSLEVGRKIISYISGLPHNNPDNTAVFLGDLSESVINSGEVVGLLLELLNSLQFKKSYIIIGNHDVKMKKGKVTSPLSFLKNENLVPTNVELIWSHKEETIEGLKVLMLPHIHNDGIHSVKDYESMVFSPTDLVVGHFADSSDTRIQDTTVNIDHISCRWRCLGHIHTRVTPSYIGSVVPNSISERNKAHRIRIYQTGHEMIEEAIPTICDYYDIKYPDPLPITPARVPIFTIYNCKDPYIAETRYGDIFIRKCVYDIGVDLTNFHEYCSIGKSADKKTVKDLIQSFLDENPEDVSDALKLKILEYCPSY